MTKSGLTLALILCAFALGFACFYRPATPSMPSAVATGPRWFRPAPPRVIVVSPRPAPHRPPHTRPIVYR